MKFRKVSVFSALLAGAMVGLAAGAAQAACREDLLATAQNLQRTRAGVEEAAKGAAAAQCAAYRQHITALTKVRTVFARCDTGAAKVQNAAKVGNEIATFTKQMRASCKS
jgi:hypothetical protein